MSELYLMRGFTGPSVVTQATASGADANPLGMFGHDPWWLVLVKSIGIFVFLLLTPMLAVYAERKIVAFMQMRVGPNRSGRAAACSPSPTA